MPTRALAGNLAAGATERNCPLCESDEQIDRDGYSSPPWRIVECARCAFVYLANPIEYRDLVEEHSWEKSKQTESARRLQDRPLLYAWSKGTRWRTRLTGNSNARIYAQVFKRGRVLDVGCGVGRALPQPLVPYGVEISRYLATQADHSMRKRGGYCIHAPALEGIKTFDDGFFQGVNLRSFLEHENKPLPLLREVFRVLADDGIVYVRVPNFSSVNRWVMGRKWCGFRHPDHVNYFTPASLEKMCALAGLAMQIRNPIRLAVDDNIKALLTKTKQHVAKPH